MTEELSKGFTGIEVNGVRFSNIKEMLIYMNKQRVRIINLENENAELRYQLNKNPCVKTPEWYCSDCLKENAELKEKLLAKEGYITFSSEQLTKAKEIILKLYNAARDVLMCRAEEKAYDNLSNAINDRSIEQFLKECEE